MSPGPRSRELDDDSLLKIFSKVGCGWEFARFARVSKQWRDLSCSVDYLDYDFWVRTKEELRAKEGFVSSVLRRASSRAPGNLKHLAVAFFGLEGAQLDGHWLLRARAMSLTRLELFADSLVWGPIVWDTIMGMKTLEELTIEAKSISTEEHLLLPHVLENGLQMPRLRNCNMSKIVNLPVALLETIFATCPALTVLNVECLYSVEKALRVASNSLENVTLWFNDCDEFEVTVCAPRLTTLKVVTETSYGPMSIRFESAQSLRTLSLESLHELYNPPENLQELMLTGPCNMQPLSEMLMLTPMITDLRLDDAYVDDEGSIDILAPLVNLRNIYLQWGGMLRFRAGERRFETLNVHFWPCCSSPAPEVSLFNALIEVHKIQSLVVHCLSLMGNKRMVDYQTRTVSHRYEDWRFLFELSSFYPNRIKFVD